MIKNLTVGDPHATPDDLGDCERLLELVLATAQLHQVDCVTFLGDLYNTHDILNIRVVDFWRRWFAVLQSAGFRVLDVLGNHDQVTPTQRHPHAMLAHPDIEVFDEPRSMVFPEWNEPDTIVAMPYYHDNIEFVRAAADLAASNRQAHTLFCHQTFQGATYENGFYAKDAVELAELPAQFKTVISGHIHTPQKVGRVVYIGAPRWRTKADVNTERYLWVLSHDVTGTKPLARVATGSRCRRLWAYKDEPENSFVVPPAYNRTKDRLWVDVYGPAPEAVRAREAELKAAHGAITRGFPARVQAPAVTAVHGAAAAFKTFVEAFVPPHGTPKEELQRLLGERLG